MGPLARHLPAPDVVAALQNEWIQVRSDGFLGCSSCNVETQLSLTLGKESSFESGGYQYDRAALCQVCGRKNTYIQVVHVSTTSRDTGNF